MASKRAWQERMARPAAKPTPRTFFGIDDPLGDDDQPARSTCPHCATAQPMAGLVADGCRACGQMPNRPGRSLTARA